MEEIHSDNIFKAIRIYERSCNEDLSTCPLNRRNDKFAIVVFEQAKRSPFFEALPEFLNALHRANYMSPLYLQIIRWTALFLFKAKKYKMCLDYISMYMNATKKHVIFILIKTKIVCQVKLGRKEDAAATLAIFKKILQKCPTPPEESEKMLREANAALKCGPDEESIERDFDFNVPPNLVPLARFTTIKSHSQFGSYVVSSENVSTGELLMNELPYMDFGKLVCKECYLPLRDVMIPCEICIHTVYCSVKCKVDDAEVHVWECAVLEREFHFNLISLLGLRVFLKHVQAGFKREDYQPTTAQFDENTGKIPFEQINDRFEHINPKDRYLMTRDAFVIIKYLVTVKKSGGTFIDWLGKYSYSPLNNVKTIIADVVMMISLCNSIQHKLYIDRFKVISHVAVFPNLTLLCHSCVPNAALCMIEYRATVRAIKPIAKGEPITINYVLYDSFHNFEVMDRQLFLGDEYGIHCKCEKCLEQQIEDHDFFISCPHCDRHVRLRTTCTYCSKSINKRGIILRLTDFIVCMSKSKPEALRQAKLIIDEIRLLHYTDTVTKFYAMYVCNEIREGKLKDAIQWMRFSRNKDGGFFIDMYLSFIAELKHYTKCQYFTKAKYFCGLDGPSLSLLVEHLRFVDTYMKLHFPLRPALITLKKLTDYYSIQLDILHFQDEHNLLPSNFLACLNKETK